MGVLLPLVILLLIGGFCAFVGLLVSVLRALRECQESIRILRKDLAAFHFTPPSRVIAPEKIAPPPEPEFRPAPIPLPEDDDLTLKPAISAVKLDSLLASVAEEPMSPPRVMHAEPEPEVPSSEFERRAKEAWNKGWSWIVVGEEFRSKKMSVEYAVATTWLLRCAVLIVLIALGYFIKYSHENALLSPELRISGVVLGALALLVFAHKLTNSAKYRLLGLGLSGVGVVMLYFAIFGAASVYKFLPAMAAFPLMIGITLFAALLALRKNALFIALIAVTGGYATPIMLSTGEKNLPGLFAYLLLIGAGALFLAFYRNWRLLNGIAFFMHYGLFTLAVKKFADSALVADSWTVLLASGAFFILFCLLPLCHSLVHKRQIILWEALLLWANTGVFFWIGINFAHKALPDHRYAAGVTLFAALVFALQNVLFLTRKVRDRNLYLSLLTLCLFAVTLSIALLLSSAWLAAAWSIQAALLLYCGKRAESRFLTLLATLLYAVAGFQSLRFFGHSGGTYFAGLLDRFLSLGVYAAALATGSMVLKSNASNDIPESVSLNEEDAFRAVRPDILAEVFLWCAALFITALFRMEIARLPLASDAALRLTLAAALYCGFLAFVLWRDAFSRASGVRQWMLFFAFAALTDLVYLTASGNWGANDYFFHAPLRLAGFLLFVPALALFARTLLRRRTEQATGQAFAWLGGIVWFAYSSAELYHALELFLPGFVRGGLSVLWTLYALTLLVFGIRYRNKSVRITGLTLFGIVALKSLLFDLAHQAALYRILALLALGILFFVGAFAYMRVEQAFRPVAEEEGKDE